MPTGPNLEQISAGQPLVAGKVARNFASIQAFLASIPNDNLLSQYAPYDALRFTAATQLASTTTHVGYISCAATEPPSLLSMDVHLIMAANIDAAGKGIQLQLQRSSQPPGPSGVWTDVTGVSADFTSLIATQGALGNSEYFHTFNLNTTQAIAGRWLRWTLVVGTVQIDWIDVVVAAKVRLSQ